VVGLSTTALANENTDRLWNDFNKTIMKNDCKASLVKLEHLIKIDPNMAYAQKAFLYEKGHCLPRDIDKAIQNYQMVPKEKIDSMFALNLAHLLFTKAQTPKEKNEALSGVRDILLKEIPIVKTSAKLEDYLKILYPNSPDFLSALEGEFAYIKSLEKDIKLKLLEIQKFIADDRLHILSEFWLVRLRNEGNIQAYFLSAKLFEADLDKRKRFLRFAAKGGHPEAQQSLAKMYEAENTRGSLMFAYYWNLKAKQNGLDVNKHLARLKHSMSQSDIAVMEDEASKETPSLPF
ncbi:MAG: hypothetical protein HWE34_02330, partial [Methylocystaceae bacterium]|nr:hypothetical protein [Methylocystaceae bacterium]